MLSINFQWEYMTKIFPTQEDLEAALVGLGKDGWEAWFMGRDEDDFPKVFLKRQSMVESPTNQ